MFPGKEGQKPIRQIKDRNYTQALEGYTGESLLVGINYDRENKNKLHSRIIEKMKKGYPGRYPEITGFFGK